MTLRTRGRVIVEEFNEHRRARARRTRDPAAGRRPHRRRHGGSRDAASVDGEPTVLLTIRRQSGTNTVQVVDAVKERWRTEAAAAARLRMEVVRDVSELHSTPRQATVEEHLILGSFLAALVVLLFLGNCARRHRRHRDPDIDHRDVRTDWEQGFTLNTMTLLALTLAVGIVIDDAIVVLENIYRFIEEKGVAEQAARRGDPRDRSRRPRDDAFPDRDLRPGRVHGRHRRPLHDRASA